MTALNQVMRDIEQNYPNLFDLNTSQGREFVNRFHKYLEVEKEQIIDALFFGIHLEYNNIDSPLQRAEQYYTDTYEK